jgi:hypothetical protein
VGATVVAAATVLSGCEIGSTLGRIDSPQVLTGAALPTFVGASPSVVVGFAYVEVDGAPEWRQIPVQIDQRKVVNFGTRPADNTTPGTVGTVYGNGSSFTALQYASAGTWVGADPNAAFDADDELVFMSGDAGGERDPGFADPAGVVAGSGVRVDLTDPVDTAKRGSVYLFRSSGGLVPSAGKDYVDYDFTLTSGNYLTTYKRRTGPNPETSKATTDSYSIDFTDRWYETTWRLPGSGVDVLDGHKNQFAVNFCGRSNKTFADEEGAFVVNVDGPVRAIRSYVGANSGPYTQRTHLLYRAQEVVLTDLRVHAIPGVMDFVDFSAAAVGMTYRSESVPGGVPIDGVLDAVPTTPVDWEAVSGPQGTVIMNVTYQASFDLQDGTGPEVQWFQRDQASPPEAQCWGDSSFYGAAGPSIVGGIPNTDPAEGAFETLRGVRTTWFGGATTAPEAVDDVAAAWSAQLLAPPTVSVHPA